jgi:DNA-binding MarR family transcriptional regulator
MNGSVSATVEDDEKASVRMAGLDQQLGFALRLAQVAVFKDLLDALAPCGLRLAEFSALTVIAANPGLNQQALGGALSIQRPNLVVLLDRLEARGLIRRGALPGDRRAYALTLTAEGQTLLAQASRIHAEHERKITSALSEADRRLMLRILKQITRAATT